MEEVIIFVDESKPRLRELDDSKIPPERAILFYGRMFHKKCLPMIEPLTDILRLPEVMDWHDRSLLESDHFPVVLECLTDPKVAISSFFMTKSFKDFKDPLVVERFHEAEREFERTNGGGEFAWDFSKIEQRALFHFLASISDYFKEQQLDPKIMFDLAQSDFKKSVRDAEKEYKGFVPFGGDAYGINKQEKSGPMSGLIPWINLVDGELWIFQRFQHMELCNLDIIWERALKYMRDKSSDPLVTQEDIVKITESAIYNPPADALQAEVNKRFGDYVAAWIEWIQSGKIIVVD